MDGPVELPDKLFFKIGEVARIVGVEPYVLRYWETEFRNVRPRKTRGGQRMYSRGDVETFLRIKGLLRDEGFTIAGARKRLGAGRAARAEPGVGRRRSRRTRARRVWSSRSPASRPSSRPSVGRGPRPPGGPRPARTRSGGFVRKLRGYSRRSTGSGLESEGPERNRPIEIRRAARRPASAS